MNKYDLSKHFSSIEKITRSGLSNQFKFMDRTCMTCRSPLPSFHEDNPINIEYTDTKQSGELVNNTYNINSEAVQVGAHNILATTSGDPKLKSVLESNIVAGILAAVVSTLLAFILQKYLM
ncbi:hypothetical protein AB4440_17840 [Vibrio splendidus]|uniref:hypothetical protein n=1 Tax=Vibrio splendidus TaxID=29497 RepID=UPI000C84AFD9|nr:hypothetical protein [Vibrio splendidus]PMO94457.1 hypothetical protein BCS97_17275 [Vibrio splendidus]PMP33292.1 hypothetical protein BCS89_23730 [Vibrio splendidus]PMP33956.1 hypothetical protein BCS88_11965 [Vibrio splendidus]PMP45662.1 hypothetical protein BCS87_23665 [Vibrio splendidus]PMP45962.1 hypothetical protein BCS85_16285 [Vibrio splendidus]